MTARTNTWELWALRTIERELRRKVVLHDDGSLQGMYDLRVGTPDSPDVAIECVRAVDSKRAETWNVGPSRGPLKSSLVGDWIVELYPDTPFKPIKEQIERILTNCELSDITGFWPLDWNLKWQHPKLFEELDSLKVASVDRFQVKGDGEIHFTMTGIGGVVHVDGSHLPTWVASFLRAPEQADVLRKLNASRARERHVFIHVSFGGVPWEVESYLQNARQLPPSSPNLPSPIDAVWITQGRIGLLWNGAWQLFENET